MTQPCGAPVLVMENEDVILPTLVDCGLSLRKLCTQWMRSGGIWRSWSFLIIWGRWMVLNAELKSMKRSLA